MSRPCDINGILTDEYDLFTIAKRDNLRLQADEWIKKHPEMYEGMKMICRMRVVKGEKFGFKAIAEQMRWGWLGRTNDDGDEYKIPNAIVTYIGRRLIQEMPGLEKYVKVMPTKY